MKATAELSLYPLTEDFENNVFLFIDKLKENKALEVYTHSMSTFIKGEHDLILNAISVALDAVNQKAETISLVIKLINRDLPVEKGFLNL